MCRTIAQNILQQGTKFHYDDFMETWQNALPDGFHIQVSKFKKKAPIASCVALVAR